MNSINKMNKDMRGGTTKGLDSDKITQITATSAKDALKPWELIKKIPPYNNYKTFQLYGKDFQNILSIAIKDSPSKDRPILNGESTQTYNYAKFETFCREILKLADIKEEETNLMFRHYYEQITNLYNLTNGDIKEIQKYKKFIYGWLMESIAIKLLSKNANIQSVYGCGWDKEHVLTKKKSWKISPKWKHNYNPDIKAILKNGKTIYIEVKSWMDWGRLVKIRNLIELLKNATKSYVGVLSFCLKKQTFSFVWWDHLIMQPSESRHFWKVIHLQEWEDKIYNLPNFDFYAFIKKQDESYLYTEILPSQAELTEEEAIQRIKVFRHILAVKNTNISLDFVEKIMNHVYLKQIE